MNKELFIKQCQQVQEICGPNGWDLYNNSDAISQHLKAIEECGELAKSVNIGDYSETGAMDDIGDILVCWVNYRTIDKLSIDSFESPLLTYSLDGDFVKQDFLVLSSIISSDVFGCGYTPLDITVFCDRVGLRVNECFQIAIDTISKRKGHYENGVFVKDED